LLCGFELLYGFELLCGFEQRWQQQKLNHITIVIDHPEYLKLRQTAEGKALPKRIRLKESTR
jgi:hypothetical protein